MRLKSFLFGVAVGAISGYASNKYLSNQGFISAEKVLETAKDRFKAQGPISGSWIHMKVEPYDMNNLTYQVYKGGISKKSKNGQQRIEFIADAKTGTLLDVYSI
jgi:predicted small secreted protein